MLNKQFSSLNISKNQLEIYLKSVGYWGNDYLRKRNEFVLSPCAYKVNVSQYDSLNNFARKLYSSLENIAKKVHALAQDVPRNRDDQELMGIVSHGSRRLLLPSDTQDDKIPPILKVDIVQTCNGDYQAVEVDAYNPRGLGFNALLNGVTTLSNERVRIFETTKILAQMLKEFSPSGKVAYFIADYERYYEPSFIILKAALVVYGVDLILIKENEYAANDIVSKLSSACDGCVFMIPESFQNVILRDNLLEAYKNGSLKMFFPPKAYLGSKLLLPYLSSQFGVRSFIPKTELLSKRYNFDDILKSGSWLIKAGQSSGAKGVFFSDLNAVEFQKRIEEEKKKKRPTWILQKKVQQETLMLETFVGNSKCFNPYYLRLIAQITSDGVIGLEITGRMDALVHGAPDCIMLPSIF
jgi:hypothetical protein